MTPRDVCRWVNWASSERVCSGSSPRLACYRVNGTLCGVSSFETVLVAVLPVYLLLAIGFFLRRRRFLPVEVDAGLMKLVIHFLYPCFILHSILGNSLVRDFSLVASGIGLGFSLIVIASGVAWLVSHFLKIQSGPERRTFCQAGGVQNYGYTAVPLLMVLDFGTGSSDESGVLGVLFVHNLGVEFALWIVGVMILTGEGLKSWRFLLNGPLVAVVLGLTLANLGLENYLALSEGPLLGRVVRQAMNWLGLCAFPLALLLIGATIGDLLGKERLKWNVSLGSVLVRNVLMAGVILSAAKFLPLAMELRQVLVVQAAMPAAVTPILMARLYGGRPQVAVQVVITTSAVGILTIPLVIAWGLSWIF